MKKYMKPSFEYVTLRSEEMFAGASGCNASGECSDADWPTIEQRLEGILGAGNIRRHAA